MRLLVVNSNTTEAVTARIEAEARAAAAPGTVIEAVTAPFGLPLIVTRADWQVAGTATLAALGARAGHYDAAIIACFGDPGLDAAKMLAGVPVLGISEAAFHAACMLGKRFGVVSFTRDLQPMFEMCLDLHGLRGRCAGFRMGPSFAGDPGRVAEEAVPLVRRLVAEAVEQDGAEVVIVAGGPLAGVARRLGAEAPVPLIDGTAAAVSLAEALVRLSPRLPRQAARAPVGLDP
ncbi:MAG: aspartate/glutamate racemase family protein, partial [Acetobacteraceae bacterium]|nr:aspartate/glutamate racemase family protein [Acetobacteraceae bacterium]